MVSGSNQWRFSRICVYSKSTWKNTHKGSGHRLVSCITIYIFYNKTGQFSFMFFNFQMMAEYLELMGLRMELSLTWVSILIPVLKWLSFFFQSIYQNLFFLSLFYCIFHPLSRHLIPLQWTSSQLVLLSPPRLLCCPVQIRVNPKAGYYHVWKEKWLNIANDFSPAWIGPIVCDFL